MENAFVSRSDDEVGRHPGAVIIQVIVNVSMMLELQDDESHRGKWLMAVYQRLLDHYGHAGWWPGGSAFEVCVGAILTQNTSWSNVEKALSRLRSRKRLSFPSLRPLPPARIAPLIRSSGCYNVKARRLAAFLRFVDGEYGGDVAAMATEERWELRRKLLAVDGIGPETADSIALYAAGQPLFVVDAYTRRIFERLGVLELRRSYDDVQRLFMDVLPEDAPLYNDFHAQLVHLAKDVCRKRPRCPECPLRDLCPQGRASVGSAGPKGDVS